MKNKLILFLGFVLWSNLQIASESYFTEDDADDTEFYDAQEGDAAPEEELTPLQKLMTQFPDIDEYTGVNNSLDMQRADIIKDLMYCFIYSLSNGKEHSQYQKLIKKYNRIQKKREELAQLAEEIKPRYSYSPRSPQDSSSLSSQHGRTVEGDSDDFGDYESVTSQKEKQSRGLLSPEHGNIRRSNDAFDW